VVQEGAAGMVERASEKGKQVANSAADKAEEAIEKMRP